MSLWFYGKRPGTGKKLDNLNMQFALQETGSAAAALEASWREDDRHRHAVPGRP